jgi:hypothetical protein
LRNLDFARKWEEYGVHSIEKKSGGPIPWFKCYVSSVTDLRSHHLAAHPR